MLTERTDYSTHIGAKSSYISETGKPEAGEGIQKREWEYRSGNGNTEAGMGSQKCEKEVRRRNGKLAVSIFQSSEFYLLNSAFQYLYEEKKREWEYRSGNGNTEAGMGSQKWKWEARSVDISVF